MSRVIEADGLKHAPYAMPHVQAQQNHRKDVPSRNPPHREAGDYVVVNITFNELRTGMKRRRQSDAASGR